MISAFLTLTFVFSFFLPLALVKLLVPVAAFRRQCTLGLAWMSDRWLDSVNFLSDHCIGVRYEFQGVEHLEHSGHYLIFANHNSWWDILTIFYFCRRHNLPFPRFFLKRALLWLPMIGFVCWALDMPFVYRVTKEQVHKNPQLKGRDLEVTRRACQKFRDLPVTVINFLEGTRFTQKKHDAQKSPYRNLLRPRASGAEFMLNAMGEMFDGIIDLTITYAPTAEVKLTNIAMGRIRGIKLKARLLPVPLDMVSGDLRHDPHRRSLFHRWVSEIWAHKDAELDQLRTEFRNG